MTLWAALHCRAGTRQIGTQPQRQTCTTRRTSATARKPPATARQTLFKARRAKRNKVPDMEHYLNIAIRSIFLENMALAYFLGMCSFLACSKKVETALGLGVAVFGVLAAREGARGAWPHWYSRLRIILTLLVLGCLLAAVLAGLGMLWFDWRWLDPATALLVALVVAFGAFVDPAAQAALF